MRDVQMHRNGSPFASPQGDQTEIEYIANPEMIIKHPLENTWTLWYFKNDRSKDWEENQREVMSFNTVEDFWSVFNHIEKVSKLLTGCDYSFFKQGIKPMWEDKANKSGGRWLINVEKRQRQSGPIDEIWLDVILCLIGETFEESGTMVNGAVVSIRPKMDKICLWLRDSGPKDAVLNVGRKLKKSLGFGVQSEIYFEAHADTMQKSSSQVKSKFIV